MAENTSAVQDLYKCTPCTSKNLGKVGYIAHILGKRHQKNLKSRNQPQANDEVTRTIHVTGFDGKTPVESVLAVFLQYGVRNVSHHHSYTFIEFESGNATKTVLAKSHYLGGTRLHVSARHRKNFQQDTVTCAIPLSRNLSNLLAEQVSGRELDKVIESLIFEIQLKVQDYQNREFLRISMVEFLTPHFPHVYGYIFGSSANNLGFVGCDVDMYVDLGVNPWAEGNSKVESECKASDLTWYLAREIRRSGRGTRVQAVARARVPIVKFQDSQTGLMVDLSFRHGMPVYNTQLICQYSCTHPLVRPYLMLIRYWAKIQGVAGGGKPSYLITNYALTMLMLFNLMVREDPIIPSVAYLKRIQGIGHRGIIIGGWDCTFDQNVSEWNSKRHNVSVMELVAEFFTYYGKLEASKWVVSPLAGELLDKTALKNRKSNELPPCLEQYCRQKTNIQVDTAFCVQDPLEHSHNCTRGLQDGPLAEFQYKCRKAAAICSNVVKGEQSLSDFLSIIEITPDILKELCSDFPKELDQNVEEIITLDDSDDASQDSVEIVKVSSAKEFKVDAVPPTKGNSTLKMDVTKSGNISEDEDVIVVISNGSREVYKKNMNNIASTMEISENGIEDSNAEHNNVPLVLPESVPEKKPYKFKLHFSGIPEFNITVDGAVSGGKGVMIAEDDIGQAACSIVHFALQQCLKIEVSVIEAFLGDRKRKSFTLDEDVDTGKRIKGVDGESVLVARKYRRLAQYDCIAALQLWIGRRKVSKSVPLGKNITPLQHELAITEVQISSDSSTSSDRLDFVIELWQKCSDPSNILVTGDSRSSLKITRAQMIPMFCYLTSLSQSLLKKLTNFVINTSSKR